MISPRRFTALALMVFGTLILPSGSACDTPRRVQSERITRVTSGLWESHVVAGKVTLMDFYSEGCYFCKLLRPSLETLVLKNEGVHLTVVDLTDNPEFQSKAEQTYKLEGLPYMRFYGRDGSFIGELVANETSYSLYGKNRQTLVKSLPYADYPEVDQLVQLTEQEIEKFVSQAMSQPLSKDVSSRTPSHE